MIFVISAKDNTQGALIMGASASFTEYFAKPVSIIQTLFDITRLIRL